MKPTSARPARSRWIIGTGTSPAIVVDRWQSEDNLEHAPAASSGDEERASRPPSRHLAARSVERFASHGTFAQAVRLRLVPDVDHAAWDIRGHPPGLLLDDVGQFVAEEILARAGRGVVVPRGEVDVVTQGEGDGPNVGGLVPFVDADAGEIRPQRRLHLVEQGWRQRSTASRCAAWRR